MKNTTEKEENSVPEPARKAVENPQNLRENLQELLQHHLKVRKEREKNE